MSQINRSDPLPTDATVIDALMVDWHEDWKTVLNDHVNRNAIVGKGVLRWMEYSRKVWFVSVGDRGTIIQRFDGESAHFMSFYVDEYRNFIVFDPAGPGSDYADPLLRSKLQRKLEGFNVVISPCSPQRSDADNFCQTWSLAWLIGGKYEDVVKAAHDQMKGRSKVDSETIEFQALAELCDLFMTEIPVLPAYNNEWQNCRHLGRLVVINFIKFLRTRANFVGDRHVRRELFPGSP